MKNRNITVMGLLIMLSGCGGGGGAGSGIDPRLARLDIYEAQKLRILGDPAKGVASMPLTELENVPTSGTTMFAGSATVRVENGAATLVMFGDAEVTLGFDTQDGTGTLDNFFGNDTNGAVVDYSGTIDLTADINQTAFTLNYAGTLSAPGDSLNFAGQMEGLFVGNPLRAIAAADLEARVDHNGTGRDATLVVIGEISASP